MNDLRALYGTDTPPESFETVTHGDVSLTLQGGALRHIRVNGVEVIRSVAFLVRDRDWGTVVPRLGPVERETAGALRLTIPMRFDTATGRLEVVLSVEITGTGLQVLAHGRATGRFETNRAGFTVLHPIDGVAGAPATVTHPDGTREAGHFPLLIAPWQPFKDIAALEHVANGLHVRCALTGDVFEMEDQRQWGDASFKTYNRPLALPWPYRLENGETLCQSVAITWERAAEAACPPAWEEPPANPTFPQMALVLTAEDARSIGEVTEAVRFAGPQRLLCHVDAAAGPVGPQVAAFAALQSVLAEPRYDLELICRFDGAQSPEEELADHARAAADAGLTLSSVFVCPSVDRQSTPPGSEWPDCPPLDRVHLAAADAFPDLPRGGGMASFFPELNRKRPPSGMLDFVTHGLCPIVHAADDVSVIETLEAVPHIARSARAIAAGRGYRIGPATIAMRQNPYGSRTIPNPGHDRVCMTDDDPRHCGTFGAAYAVGLAATLAPFAVDVWTPAAVLGPRGLTGPDGFLPIAHALRALAGWAGQPVHGARIADGMAILHLGGGMIRANLTPRAQDGLPAFGWGAEGNCGRDG